MFYWNQSNFEGLKSVGEQYLSKKGYECFANYCLLKEKGLKKQANQSMNKFVSNIDRWNEKNQRNLAQELTSLWFWNQDIHQLISHPLQQFIYKTLEEWCISEPNSLAAHRWFGCMGGGIEYFEKALVIDSTDEISITRLAQAHINDADYQTHHLSESKLLGTKEELSIAIVEAKNYACMLTTKSLKVKLLEEINYYSNLANAWEQYNDKNPDMSFPEWTKSIGKDFNFSSIVYYNE